MFYSGLNQPEEDYVATKPTTRQRETLDDGNSPAATEPAPVEAQAPPVADDRPTPKQSPRDLVHASIAATRAEKLDAERHRDTLVEGLATAQTAAEQAEAQADLQRCDDEIARLSRKLTDFERALRLIEERDDRARALQKFQQVKEARKTVDARGDDIEADIERLLTHIDGIAPILASIEGHGRDRADAAYSIIRECSKDPAREWQDSLVGALTGRNHAARIIDALYASGIGRVGIWLAPFVEVLPARGTQSAEEVNNDDRNIVTRRLNALLKKREAELTNQAKETA